MNMMDADMMGDDVFSHVFGGGGGGMGGFGGLLGGLGGMGRRRGPAKGESTVHRLKVSLEEMYCGKVSKLQLSKNTICQECQGMGGKGPLVSCRQCNGRGIQVTVNQIGPGMVQQMQSKCSGCNGEGELMSESDKCKKCSGRKVVNETKILEVNVEPGMKDEQKIIFRGEGDQMPGVEPGDVYIVLLEKPHANYKRDGHDLILKKSISLTEALCGFKTTIETLDGRTLAITHKPGEVIKPSNVRTVVGEGMPVYRDNTQKGDLLIHFDVEFPENYFANETKLKELEGLLGGRAESEDVPEDAEEVDLSEFEARQRSSGMHDDDDERHGHGHGPQVQCAQQ